MLLLLRCALLSPVRIPAAPDPPVHQRALVSTVPSAALSRARSGWGSELKQSMSPPPRRRLPLPLSLPRSSESLDLSKGTPRFLPSEAGTQHLEQGAAARDGSLVPKGVRFLFAITSRTFDPSLLSFATPRPHRPGFGDLDYSRCCPLLTLVSIYPT